MSKVRIFGRPNVEESARGWFVINCPACGEHVIAVDTPFPSNGAAWQFNRDMEKPTFSPSLLVKTGKYVDPSIVNGKDEQALKFIEETSYICHSFIRDGKIEFLSDCTHKLAGQTVELLDVKNYDKA